MQYAVSESNMQKVYIALRQCCIYYHLDNTVDFGLLVMVCRVFDALQAFMAWAVNN